MPDVYLLILDSVSTFMAKRGLPKTIAYLKDHMGAVQMEFLNKVGINSRPNGFPLMFGKSVEGGSRDLVGLPPLVPDWNDSVMCHKPLDRYHYMISEYSNAGYKIGHLRLGQYEDRNPFLMVILPAVYRNTSIHVQLEQKVLELMTHFDLHATLIDILKLQPSSNFSDISYRDMSPLSKGSSLFREWRGARNCRTLPIPSQYCLCQYNWTVIRDVEFQAEMGEFLVNELNQQLRNAGLKDKCQKQTYNTELSFEESEKKYSRANAMAFLN
ncbi:unnamed protein product [Heligmosomoides polygyrus]|uniref:Sulfatase domain-containing protein n=1 Tax=Heligmosomoides polygyrus TaxID=6339 RepID=A0A183FKA1_HELPZ|nr:unnamed protein product [Heligmosomoides polygyrus]